MLKCTAVYAHIFMFQFPSTTAAWLDVAKEFNEKWNFPHCIGALNGKHVVMQALANSGSYYFNYKGTHSIVLMALVDGSYKFRFADVGCNGRVSDGGVFGQCGLSTFLSDGNTCLPAPESLHSGSDKAMPFVVVADDAFPLRNNLMKPYPQKHF